MVCPDTSKLFFTKMVDGNYFMLNLPIESKNKFIMISFTAAFILLVLGYVLYGAFVEKVFGADNKIKTPAIATPDGVDYVPMSWWRIFLIQFLNIAGLGPIFGAIMGICFGPAAFLWIVFGTIFAGGVHDYLRGMLSIRKGGISLRNIIGDELGKGTGLK